MTMHAVFWVLNRQLNAAHGRVSEQTQVPETLHIFHLNVTNETSLHSKVANVEEDEEFEQIPKSWDNMISNVQNILDIEVQKPKEEVRKSFLSQSFTGLPTSKRMTDGPSLPADGIIANAWKEIKKPQAKIASFKTCHRYQYRWPEKTLTILARALILMLQSTLTFTQTKV